ncbi:MAG: valine--tRNA ligase [Patescibacteria group bacterium]|nr:valine--tRNA ligase [Patescibacteria group bacterium]
MDAKSYNAKDSEDQIYKKWEKSGAFSPKVDPKKKSFTISMPPPNATGTLHLGHSIMLAIEDIMIRFKRMQGYSALWLPGTDHAAIATQNKVEKLLAEKGQDRHELGREKFLEEVKKFVANSQATIRNQIRKMGSSCDWSRERYTLDDGLTKAVMTVFVKMYEDGLIYRGNRLVNWCPRCESTLADDEVEHKDIQGHFYHIKYPLKDEKGYIEIATTRPETMLADTAIAVHPKDKRYKKLIGKTAILPLVGREIPIIADEYVDIELGTGALKVTPAHDPNDFELGKKHDLQTINILTENGTLNKEAGKNYEGLDRFEARKKVAADLEEQDFLIKTEDHMHSVGHCYRCSTQIEPFISLQWFIDVNKPVINGKSLKERSIEVIKDGSIKILPSRFNKTYYNWMENLHDWCISRQIWWGHRIPVWYCQECDEEIVATESPNKCKCGSKKLKQDQDTLDTWFSSGLWTFSTLGWPDNKEELEYFHPTSVMETGYDILFFWIARMILMTTYTLGEIPFETVYLHGLIRTKSGEKMSKSKPETCIDPLDMIEKYGADALRLSLVIGSTPGNDTRLYEEKIAGYRNFINKIWNSARYVLMNIEEGDYSVTLEDVLSSDLSRTDKWILTRLDEVVAGVTKNLGKHSISEAGNEIYEFMWGEFCDWYLEMSKVKKNTKVLSYVLKNILILLHPFVPFITEVVWGNLNQKNLLIVETWPKKQKELHFSREKEEVEVVKSVITAIRSLRSESNVDASKKIQAVIHGGRHTELLLEKIEIIKRLANLGELEVSSNDKKMKNSLSAVVKEVGIYLPLEGIIDMNEEKKRLGREVENLQKLLTHIEKKLSNKGFVAKAPKEIIEKEEDRKAGILSDLKKIKEQLKHIS